MIKIEGCVNCEYYGLDTKYGCKYCRDPLDDNELDFLWEKIESRKEKSWFEIPPTASRNLFVK